MTTFTQPIDFYNYAASFYKSLPKTVAEGKEVLEKVQAVITTESNNVQATVKAYTAAAKSSTPLKDFDTANKKAAELVKTATFASIVAMPGALFVLPLVVEKAKEFKIDLVPASVAAQFSI
jgi:hypothetical protein